MEDPPDGQYLVFQSEGKLAWARSDGSGRVVHLAGTRQAFPSSFSSDGRRLFSYQATGGTYDVWEATMEKSGASFGPPRRLIEDPGYRSHPAISPDGKWLAYATSFGPASADVYVVALLPDGRIGNGKWQVSNRSGRLPIWARNGRDLFYRSGEEIMVVSYTTKGNVFVPEKPRLWSDKRMCSGGGQYTYDVAPDGKKVVALFDAGDDSAKPETHLRVVLNAREELRRRAAAAGN